MKNYLKNQINIWPMILFSLIILVSCKENTDYFLKGELEEKRNNYKTALKLYEEAQKINPQNIEVYYRIGNLYRSKILNGGEKALLIYKKGQEFFPDDFKLKIGIMQVYFELGDKKNGMNNYRLLSKSRGKNEKYSFPRRPLKLSKEGVKYFDEHFSPNEFIIFSRALLEINPTDLVLRNLLASIYINKGDFEKAIIEYEILLKYADSKGDIYFDLGLCNI